MDFTYHQGPMSEKEVIHKRPLVVVPGDTVNCSRWTVVATASRTLHLAVRVGQNRRQHPKCFLCLR